VRLGCSVPEAVRSVDVSPTQLNGRSVLVQRVALPAFCDIGVAWARPPPLLVRGGGRRRLATFVAAQIGSPGKRNSKRSMSPVTLSGSISSS
jgi:hypothetical protein